MARKSINSYFRFILLPLHIFLIISLVKMNFNFWLTFFLWILLSGFGIGVGFHRLLSHRSFKTYLPIEYALSFLGCLGAQGSPLFWVTIHQNIHHPFADQEKDLHSPIYGFFRSYIAWTSLVSKEDIGSIKPSTIIKDWFQFKVLHLKYFYVLWGVWILTYLISPQIFYALVIAQAITLHQEFFVNYFSHKKSLGYRNFQTNDNSNNMLLFGLIFWGVGYHNNHHHKPSDYNFGHRWHELDPTVLLVNLVKKRT